MKKIKHFLFLGALALVLGACATTQSGNQKVVDAMENQFWQLDQATIDGQPVDIQDGVITVTYQDGRLGGSSGVNRYSGPVTITDSDLSFTGPIIMTRMAGPDHLMRLENTYVSALPKITHFEIQNDTLILRGKDATTYLKFHHINPESNNQ